MELRHLRYFVAVAEERHITKAAQRLGIAQPPLSLQIRQLEQELGTRLFDRTPKGVEPTLAGAAFLEEARDILARVRQAAAHVAQVADGRTGQLSLGMTTSAVLHPFVPRLIQAFRAAYPAVALDLQEDNAAAITHAVQNDELAAGLLRQPSHRPHGLAFLELGEEPMVAALPASHAPRPSAHLADFASDAFILVRRPGAPGMYADLLEACRTLGFEPRIAAEVPHMLTAISLVAAGIGITVLPASMAQISLPALRYVPLDDPTLRAPLTLAYPAATPTPLLANLLATARTLQDA